MLCLNSGVSSLLSNPNNTKPSSFTTCNSKISSIKLLPYKRNILSFNDRSRRRRPFPEIKLSASLGIQTPLLFHGRNLFQSSLDMKLPKVLSPIRASYYDDVPHSYRYPAMEEKPRWWWRTLSCLPYLMPLFMTCLLAESSYHVHPFRKDIEFLTEPFWTASARLPIWFPYVRFFIAHLGVVARKEWPHFFRFHVLMGMLLEIAVQIAMQVLERIPTGFFLWGKIGMSFWSAMTFAYFFTVLECIRCALAGMYADVPFFEDAAYMGIPYD